jgi:hypothetical protein
MMVTDVNDVNNAGNDASLTTSKQRRLRIDGNNTCTLVPAKNYPLDKAMGRRG